MPKCQGCGAEHRFGFGPRFCSPECQQAAINAQGGRDRERAKSVVEGMVKIETIPTQAQVKQMYRQLKGLPELAADPAKPELTKTKPRLRGDIDLNQFLPPDQRPKLRQI